MSLSTSTTVPKTQKLINFVSHDFYLIQNHLFRAMVKTGIGTDELKKPKFWQIAAGEIIGTLFVVLFTSLVVNRHDGKSVIMTIR